MQKSNGYDDSVAEWLLPIPEVRGSKPAIGKIYNEHVFELTVEETKL